MTRYAARRLPVHRGPAAWSVILPGQDEPVVLDTDQTADFAIIGAGFAGLAAARRLRQLNPTASVVVLEAGRLAEGAAGRNSGFMIDLPHDLASDDYAGHGSGADAELVQLNRAAIRFAAEAVQDYDIHSAYFDPCGKVNGAATPHGDAANKSYGAHLAALGEDHELLDAQSMAELTGSTHYTSGLFTPGTVMLQPAGFIRGLGAGLRRDRVRTFERSPVTLIARVGPDWLLHTPLGRVTAGKVILCNNGHLESFGFAKQRLMHVFLFASMTVDMGADEKAKLGGVARWGITPSDPMGTTMRRIDAAQGGNRIITRTCASFRPGMRSSAAALARAAKVHRAKFSERFPQLNSVKQEFSWAGHLCLSRNSVSVARPLDDGVFSACCQNGLGTARGTLTGIGAAEMASDHSSAFTKHLLSEAQPTRLPPRPLSDIGANAYLRWKEWRAGRE